MNRLRSVWFAWCFGCSALVSARAYGATDLRAEQTRIEDDLVEGEIDPEDFLAWHLAPRAMLGRGRGAAYLGIEAFVSERTNGSREIGALLVVELPLERFAKRGTLLGAPAFENLSATGLASLGDGADLHFDHAVAAVGGDGVATWRAEKTAMSNIAITGLPQPATLAQSATPSTGSGASHPGPSSAPNNRAERSTPVITVTTDVARACVRAALRATGLGDDVRLESIASRARSSAALPELRVRAVRTLGETGRVSLSEDDPSRYVASGAATTVLEARLTFRLDRILFADEEIAVERARLDRSELRARMAAKVLQALFEWQKAYALTADATLSADDRFAATLREAESSAILDMMTNGWFGAFRAALAARGR
jgi:hypothetical protein